MTPSANQLAVRNVLVALDDATLGLELVDAAVSLAAELDAELQGMYIENESLLRVAELPFAQEVTTGSGTLRPIDPQSIRRAMHTRATEIRSVIEHRAGSAHIPCSFSVKCSRERQQMLLHSAENDIVFLGCRSHAPSVRPPLGLRPKAAIRPLLVLIDNSPRSWRVLAASMAIARQQACPLVLLMLTHDQTTFRWLGTEACKTLCDAELAHTLLPHPISTRSALIQSARDQRPNLLIMSRQCTLINEATIDSMLNQLECSIVLV